MEGRNTEQLLSREASLSKLGLCAWGYKTPFPFFKKANTCIVSAAVTVISHASTSTSTTITATNAATPPGSSPLG